MTFDAASISSSVSQDLITFALPGTLLPGESTTIVVNFMIDESFTGIEITNIAEISADNGEDCDSTPDTNSSNDGQVTDDAI